MFSFFAKAKNALYGLLRVFICDDVLDLNSGLEPDPALRGWHADQLLSLTCIAGNRWLFLVGSPHSSLPLRTIRQYFEGAIQGLYRPFLYLTDKSSFRPFPLSLPNEKDHY